MAIMTTKKPFMIGKDNDIIIYSVSIDINFRGKLHTNYGAVDAISTDDCSNLKFTLNGNTYKLNQFKLCK